MRRAFYIAFLVIAAWACRHGVERNQPPLSTNHGGARFVTVSAVESASRGPGVLDAPSAARGTSSRHAVPEAMAPGEMAGVDGEPVAGRPTANGAASRRGLRQALEEFTWTFDDPTYGRIDVVVVLPDRYADERFPMLIALHGRGEAMKGPVRGARGWVDDYALTRAMRRLANPPLTPTDFEGIVASKRLAEINLDLQTKPYQGLVVLCPYTPEPLAGDRPFDRVRPYTKFLIEALLPRARRELPVFGTPRTTGIDGVSLGGRIGFLSGLYAADQFHTVAGLQAAFDSEDADTLGRFGDAARRSNPEVRFRLLTSDHDYFLEANQSIAAEFRRRALPIQFLLVPGPHDYIFNRGPGSIEMLYFHDRALHE